MVEVEARIASTELRVSCEALVAMLERLLKDGAALPVRDQIKQLGRTASQAAEAARQLEEALATDDQIVAGVADACART